MDRVFEDFLAPHRWGLTTWEGEWTPVMDVAETDGQVVVKAEVPGIDPKEINISLSGDVLTVKGEKKSEREEKKEELPFSGTQLWLILP